MSKPPSELYGIPINEIADLCRVSLKTAARWKAGQTVPPYTALFTLRILWGGSLAELGPEWTGWRYRGGELTSPDGWGINRNHALSVPLMERQIKERDNTIRELRDTLESAYDDGLEEQPLPGDFPAILTG